MQIVWKYLYSMDSSRQPGTLFHLRNVLNRGTVVKDPKNDFNACSDFFHTVVEGHIVAAAMHTLGMLKLTDEPAHHLITEPTDHKEIISTIMEAAKEIVTQHVSLSFTGSRCPTKPDDGMTHYAREVLSLGLLFLEFQDAIHEGDEEKVFHYWKFFFPIFMSAGRVKYTIEAFIRICQKYDLFSPRQQMQLLYSRFINTHGLPHRNIPADLHMEHLNRTVKTTLSLHGGQCPESSVRRAGQSVRYLQLAKDKLDEMASITEVSGAHKRLSDEQGVASVAQVLKANETMAFRDLKRPHQQSFKKIESNHLMSKLSKDKVLQWICIHAPRYDRSST